MSPWAKTARKPAWIWPPTSPTLTLTPSCDLILPTARSTSNSSMPRRHKPWPISSIMSIPGPTITRSSTAWLPALFCKEAGSPLTPLRPASLPSRQILRSKTSLGRRTLGARWPWPRLAATSTALPTSSSLTSWTIPAPWTPRSSRSSARLSAWTIKMSLTRWPPHQSKTRAARTAPLTHSPWRTIRARTSPRTPRLAITSSSKTSRSSSAT